MKHRPPQWYQFGWWVVAGALVGLGIAFGLFCVVHFLLYGNFAFIKHMQALAGATDVKPADIFSMTATALGGFTIGGVAVMQYRKHKWAEYQAKMDEDSRTGERLGKAIEHLSEEQKLHTRLGAIYELERLAEDSYRDKERIVKILTWYIQDWQDKKEEKIPQDVEGAARVLSQLARELIEETAEKANKKQKERPHDFIYDAAKMLSAVKKLCAIRKSIHFRERIFSLRSLLQWQGLNANHLDMQLFDLNFANLKGATFVCADLRGIFLESADLHGAKLKNADLSCARLKGANFTEAYLEGARLQGAHLERVNLMCAHLEGTDFRHARFDDKTTFGKDEWKAHINDNTRFDPGVRMKYFGVEEPEHGEDE